MVARARCLYARAYLSAHMMHAARVLKSFSLRFVVVTIDALICPNKTYK